MTDEFEAKAAAQEAEQRRLAELVTISQAEGVVSAARADDRREQQKAARRRPGPRR